MNEAGPKVTAAAIAARIKDVQYLRVPHTTVTVCAITMANGFTVTGESACADERNFSLELGKSIAYENAFEKLWALEGYLLRERLHEAASFADAFKAECERARAQVRDASAGVSEVPLPYIAYRAP